MRKPSHFVAVETASVGCREEGSSHQIHRGEVYAASHEAVRAHPELFLPHPASEAELATAAAAIERAGVQRNAAAGSKAA